MSRLELYATDNTPYVYIDTKSGKIELTGTSYPEDPVEFYRKIFKWIKENFNESSQKIDVSIKLEYFNTSSSKWLLELLQLLKKIKKANNLEVIVNWFYWDYDEDMLDAGQAYEKITKLRFEMIKRQ